MTSRGQPLCNPLHPLFYMSSDVCVTGIVNMFRNNCVKLCTCQALPVQCSPQTLRCHVQSSSVGGNFIWGHFSQLPLMHFAECGAR